MCSAGGESCCEGVRPPETHPPPPPPPPPAAASFVFYGLFVPETAGVRLEEIPPLFGDPKALVRRNLGALRAMVPRSK